MFLDTFRCLFSVLLSNIILGSFLVLMTSVVTKWCNTNIEMKMNNNHATKQKWTNSGYCDTKKLKTHPHFALLWCKIILIVDYEQSLFFFRFSKGSARARERWAAKMRAAAQEVTHVVICMSRAFCSMDQEKRETACSLFWLFWMWKY